MRSCGGPFVRFFGRHVEAVELEKQLRMGDQHGFFQNIKSVQLEETRKAESSTSVTRKGDCCETKGASARDGCGSCARC